MLAFEFNYSFSPLFFFSLSATDPLLDLEVGTAAHVAHGGGGGEIPSSSLVPRAHSQPSAPQGCVLFCFVLFMDVCDLFCFFFFFSQATKGLEKGTGNCICGEIEQMGLSRSCMDRWTDGQMGEDAQGSKMTPGGCLGMSAADTGGQALK